MNFKKIYIALILVGISFVVFMLINSYSYNEEDIVFSAFEDMFVGVRELTLKKNHEFIFVNTAATYVGTFKIDKDTIILNYSDESIKPKKFLIDTASKRIKTLDIKRNFEITIRKNKLN